MQVIQITFVSPVSNFNRAQHSRKEHRVEFKQEIALKIYTAQIK